MATWPAKTNYASGDILTASQMNDIGGELNDLYTAAGKAAGKNVIINGDFRINQRNFTSLTNANSGSYSFDRWSFIAEGSTGSATLTPQTFTAGSAPVTGYEAINYAQIVTASMASADCRSNIRQPIEDVRTFAGQTITVSFWAKAASGTPKMALECAQVFGSGGSTTVNTYAGQITLSTSWARYSITVAIPSISGKTIGTGSSLYLNFYVSAGSNFDARTGSLGNQNNTFSFWGAQAEAGSVATPFQTATGSIQGELAACQRYYQLFGKDTAYSPFGVGGVRSATAVEIYLPFVVKMRTNPTSVDVGGTIQVIDSSWTTSNATSISLPSSGAESSTTGASMTMTTTGLTANRPCRLRASNDSTAYLGFSAEL